jgi:hypothetical protein
MDIKRLIIAGLITAFYISSQASEPKKSAELKASSESVHTKKKKINYGELIKQMESGKIKQSCGTNLDENTEFTCYYNIADLGRHMLSARKTKTFSQKFQSITLYEFSKVQKDSPTGFTFKEAVIYRDKIYWHTTKKSANK